MYEGNLFQIEKFEVVLDCVKMFVDANEGPAVSCKNAKFGITEF